MAIALCRVGDSESEIQEAVGYIRATEYPLLSGFIPERTAYRRASDMGRALTETHYRSLNQKADLLMQSLVDRVDQLEERAA
jgi:chromosome partitioning protein